MSYRYGSCREEKKNGKQLESIAQILNKLSGSSPQLYRGAPTVVKHTKLFHSIRSIQNLSALHNITSSTPYLLPLTL